MTILYAKELKWPTVNFLDFFFGNKIINPNEDKVNIVFFNQCPSSYTYSLEFFLILPVIENCFNVLEC